MNPNPGESVLRRHGGYRNLLTFQLARLIYDVTVRFCNRWVERRSRTHDQMVQAARSGVQNIAEGSKAAGTSARTELKLTNVARASLEELRLDYEDFLRHRQRVPWSKRDPRTASLIAGRPQSADDVAVWVDAAMKATPNRSIAGWEVAANGAIALIAVNNVLLGRQIAAQAEAFGRDGGFTERLHKVRSKRRREEQS